MKFSVSKEKLLEGLQTVQNVVSTRTTLPILSNVLLQASEGRLRLTTTDLDVGMSGAVEAQRRERPARTTLPARRLAGIVRELPAAEVHVEVDSQERRLDPLRPELLQDPRLCPRKSFRRCRSSRTRRTSRSRRRSCAMRLKKTCYAISTDETRYVLNGILFSFKENKLTMVATDGRRLALVDLEVEFPRSQEVDIIVPTKCVTELARLLGDEGDVKMSVGENQVAFEVGRHAARLEADRGQLSELPPGHSRRSEGARHARARTLPQRRAPRVAARERKVELGEARLFQEQHRDRGEHAGRRRSARIASRRLQRPGLLDRVQSRVPHGAAAQPAATTKSTSISSTR